ncbi:MAG: hypothetical protein RL685_7678 [Pseudomonadota bacterium]|jgi:hypothetical protein
MYVPQAPSALWPNSIPLWPRLAAQFSSGTQRFGQVSCHRQQIGTPTARAIDTTCEARRAVRRASSSLASCAHPKGSRRSAALRRALQARCLRRSPSRVRMRRAVTPATARALRRAPFLGLGWGMPVGCRQRCQVAPSTVCAHSPASLDATSEGCDAHRRCAAVKLAWSD